MWSRFLKDSAHKCATQTGPAECIGEQEYPSFLGAGAACKAKRKHSHREIAEVDLGELREILCRRNNRDAT